LTKCKNYGLIAMLGVALILPKLGTFRARLRKWFLEKDPRLKLSLYLFNDELSGWDDYGKAIQQYLPDNFNYDRNGKQLCDMILNNLKIITYSQGLKTSVKSHCQKLITEFESSRGKKDFLTLY
jgi:hypothetical protein